MAHLAWPGLQASFGELALLYAKPRAATVIARTDGVLWSLTRNCFKAVAAHISPAAGPNTASGSAPGVGAASTVRTLRSVEVLQVLHLSQLQVLAEAMESVTVPDGQYIIRQGEEGKEFFIIASGQVSCTVKKNPANADEAAKEVLRLSAGQYFGERALLTGAKRAANVIASGSVTLLQLSRACFESLLGPLQDILDAEAAWKDKVAVQREVLARKNAAGVVIQQVTNNASFGLEDLEARGLLYSTDCSALMLMEHKATEEIYTVRVTSVADVVALGKQATAMRGREVTRALEPCFFVPGVLKPFKDHRVLAEILSTVGLCTLDALMGTRPFDEASAAYIAAHVALGLEHVHWSGFVYRGLSLASTIITEGGQVQLVDFRFARRNEGRAHTLCGHPEYLAPEVVEAKVRACVGGGGGRRGAAAWLVGPVRP